MASKGWRKFCARTLKMLGWTAVEPVAPEKKCIILGVPHTTIWDLVISYLYYTSVGGDAKVMVKSSVFVWPLSPILRAIGGIPVDRSNPTKVILSTVHQFNQSETMHLAMCPEGTRKPIKKWKTGYHTIARQTGASVYLGYFDWGTKTIGRGQKFELSDNAREDTDKIQAIYETMHLTGKNPGCYVTH